MCARCACVGEWRGAQLSLRALACSCVRLCLHDLFLARSQGTSSRRLMPHLRASRAHQRLPDKSWSTPLRHKGRGGAGNAAIGTGSGERLRAAPSSLRLRLGSWLDVGTSSSAAAGWFIAAAAVTGATCESEPAPARLSRCNSGNVDAAREVLSDRSSCGATGRTSARLSESSAGAVLRCVAPAAVAAGMARAAAARSGAIDALDSTSQMPFVLEREMAAVRHVARMEHASCATFKALAMHFCARYACGNTSAASWRGLARSSSLCMITRTRARAGTRAARSSAR